MKDPEHLKRWAAQTRPFACFVAKDLVDALSYPDGHRALQQIIDAYRVFRGRQPTGDSRTRQHPTLEQTYEEAVMKGEQLTEVEMDRCVRNLVLKLRAIDPKWSLERPAL